MPWHRPEREGGGVGAVREPPDERARVAHHTSSADGGEPPAGEGDEGGSAALPGQPGGMTGARARGALLYLGGEELSDGGESLSAPKGDAPKGGAARGEDARRPATDESSRVACC